MKKVMVGGVFASVHPGHIFFLEKAKSFGDFLIVVLTNDKNIKKSYNIPSAEQRKKNLESFGVADKIVIGDEKDFFKVIEKEKPDVIALGYDQEISELEKRIKASGLKTKIIRIEKHGYYSTSKMNVKNKIKKS